MRSNASSGPSRVARRIVFTAAGLLVLLLILLGGVGWIGSERAIHPGQPHYARTLTDFPALHPRPFTLESRTHTRIAATLFPGMKPATIILSHGYGDMQQLMLPYADFLNRAGYTVVTYDMRSRGESGGDAVTLGALEALDLQSVVDDLRRRPEVDGTRIGALGVSLGGSTTLLAAARDPRIRAVVDDSGFSDAPNVVESSFEHFIGLPAFPFAPITVAISGWRTGFAPTAIRPVDEVARIAPRPLLIIHCQPDRVVPPDNSERIFAAAREPKQIWRIPSGGHIDGHTVARDEYERRVTAFFDRALN